MAKSTILRLASTFPGDSRKHRSGYSYFLPGNIFMSRTLSLPPVLYAQAEKAALALGKFSSLLASMPAPANFMAAYAHAEATMSSRIEGTRTQLAELYADEARIAAERRDDWLEVRCCLRALDEAVRNLQKLPLCNRLLKRTHKTLMSHPQGKNKLPGEFRTTQNWIGGSSPGNARFVPPPPETVGEAMDNLESFLQDDRIARMPHLVKAALAHYQFETIHPFADGNGRIGRMLIPLYLLEKEILQQPVLYISGFFEANRNAYYGALDEARKSAQGMQQWIAFFLEAVCRSSDAGMTTTRAIVDLEQKLRKKISSLGRRARNQGNALRLLKALFARPVVNATTIRKTLGVSPQVPYTLVRDFTRLGILREVTGNKRNQLFEFRPYLDLLRKRA